ncbi:MAG: CocE/NonD family hydrolase C-terminal non-catalytic domain-containing protein [Solirubrobacteraceae bacterium]
MFARVRDFDAAGVSRNVSDALIGVAPGRPEQADEGSRPVKVWPMAHRFAAGHRIRLLVSSGAYPRYARNPGAGEDPAVVTTETMRALDVQLLRDSTHRSALVLPTMP